MYLIAIDTFSNKLQLLVLGVLSGCLIEQLSSEKYECMVCCDVIRLMAPVWSCHSCFHVFHLNCIKKWARSPASQADGTASPTTAQTHGALLSTYLYLSVWLKVGVFFIPFILFILITTIAIKKQHR